MTERPSKQSAALIGGGNLGSQTAPHVARMEQLGSAVLVDPNVYEEKDLRGQNILPRDVGHGKAAVQARKMKAINPALDIVPLNERVEDVPLGLLRRDLLIGGLDSKLARMRLNRIGMRLGRPIVDAGIRRDGMLGRITVCDPARGTACLECGWTSPQYENLARRTSCMDEDPVPATDAPAELGGVVASYQVIECRKLLAAGAGTLDSAYQILIDLTHHTVKVSRLPRNPECRCDHRAWEVLPLEADPAEITVGDIIEIGRKEDTGEAPSLSLYGKVLVFGLTCPECGARRRVARLVHRLSDRRRICPRCGPSNGRKMIAAGTDVADRLDGELHPELLDRSLGSLGFRPHDVFTLAGPKRELHYELLPSRTSAQGRGPHAD